MHKNRRLKIKTSHGTITTPIFLPDATRGLVKLISNDELKKTRVKSFIVNTLHLYLQPGMKIIKKAGGIHDFINWLGPIISDSGGYQIFSLIHKNPKMGRINNDGAIFRSLVDGTEHILTPEKSIKVQFDLGVDIMICLDDCPPNEYNKNDLEKSVERTIKWAARCKIEYEKQIKKRKIKNSKRPLIFSVIQGGKNLELRKKCIAGLMEVGFSTKCGPASGWDGYGFGGRPVDEDGRLLTKVLSYTANLIPENKIRFALGVGTPEDIVKCHQMGWDMFDCTIPTREGRHGRLFNFRFKNENLRFTNKFYQTCNINNSKFANDFTPVNKNSRLLELRNHNKAYLHHLFKIKEPVGQRLASLNNLEFYINLTSKIR